MLRARQRGVSEERSVRETAREEGGGAGRKRDGGINGEKEKERERASERKGG